MSDAGELLEKIHSASIKTAVEQLRAIHALKQKAAETRSRDTASWLRRILPRRQAEKRESSDSRRSFDGEAMRLLTSRAWRFSLTNNR